MADARKAYPQLQESTLAAHPPTKPSSRSLLADPTLDIPPKGSEREQFLIQITRPLITATGTIEFQGGSTSEAIRHLEDMNIAIAKIKTALELEFENLWERKKKSNASEFKEAHRALVDQASAVYRLTERVLIDVDTKGDIKKDIRAEQIQAIEDYKQKINGGVYIKESLKQLLMMFLGAAAGFLSVGYLTMDPKAAITANALGAGPIAGAAAGALMGNYLYKHGRFFNNSIIGKEFHLVNAARAYVEAVNPEDGMLAKAGRIIRKVL